MGTDAALYDKYIAQHGGAYPNLAQTVKRHRFREIKPYYIQKPECSAVSRDRLSPIYIPYIR